MANRGGIAYAIEVLDLTTLGEPQFTVHSSRVRSLPLIARLFREIQIAPYFISRAP
jgi:hypothetical protein